ncbi:MAG: hypothetical protein ABEJ79_01465 [Halolamina sp.]
MPYPVTYHCPRCGAVHELQREGYLADKTVTPYPLEGWEYADADAGEGFEDADGVRLVCGDDDRLVADAEVPGEFEATTTAVAGDLRPDADGGCGEPFYLAFVRHENGREVEPEAVGVDAERVELADDGPQRPRGPDGPGGPDSIW